MKHSFTDRKEAILAIAGVLPAGEPERIAAAMVSIADRTWTFEDDFILRLFGYHETLFGSGFDGNTQRWYVSRGFGKRFGMVPVLVTRYADGTYEVRLRKEEFSALAAP